MPTPKLLRQQCINLRFRRGHGVTWQLERNGGGQTYLVLRTNVKKAAVMRDLLQEQLNEFSRLLEEAIESEER